MENTPASATNALRYPTSNENKKEDSPKEVASKLESMLGFPVDVE
jgi:hypothetical protein